MHRRAQLSLLGVGIISTTMAFTNISEASSVKYANTTENLNLRTSPNTSSKIITTMKKGSKVEIISYDGGWAKVKYSNQTGYCSKQYLKESSSSSTTEKKTGIVTTDTLNVRSGAGTSYSKIGTVKKGQTVTILQTNGVWHKIEMSSNKTGWVSGDYVKINTESGNGNNSNDNNNSTDKKIGEVTTDTLNVRSGAGTSYSKIGTVKKGQKVTILETKSGWHKIEMPNNQTGWVSGDYIKINTNSDSGNNDNNNNDNNNNNSDKKIGTVTTDALNVRSGAGTSYSKTGTVKKGQKVTILETKSGWHKIEMPNNQTGWVSGDYIKIESYSDDNTNDTTQKPLPTPTGVPTYVDAPFNSAVMNSKYDVYQDNLTLEKNINSGLKSLAIKSNESFGVEYEAYGSGAWKKSENGNLVSSSNGTIEGVKIKLKNAPSNYHVFYRVKIANQGWQNWVKDGDISGEIQVGKSIADIEIRVIVESNVSGMVKDTIAVDLGHNVPRPMEKGAVNGIYNEEYLIREVGKQVIYKLRSLGYNVVETKPIGAHSQSNELKIRAQIANANQADKFVSVHFNSGVSGANGTEVLYSNPSSSKTRAERVSKNISEAFGFKNRGAKQRTDLYVLNNTNMPAILVEGCFLDQIDMNKFIAKGSNAYSIMADAIINGVIQ